MSFQAMTWAIEQALPTREKFVLLMLANFASAESGECYPSLNRLARDTGMSRNTVIAAIQQLEAVGAVHVMRRTADGVSLPNAYRLDFCFKLPHPSQGSASHAPPPQNAGSANAGGVVQMLVGGSAPVAPKPVIKPINTTTTKGAPAGNGVQPGKPKVEFDFDAGVFVGPIGDHFGRWRQAYPAIDVDAEVLRAAAWLVANPKNRKSNYLSFLTNWMSRAQDRSPRSGGVVVGGAMNGGNHGKSGYRSRSDRNAAFAADILGAAFDN